MGSYYPQGTQAVQPPVEMYSSPAESRRPGPYPASSQPAPCQVFQQQQSASYQSQRSGISAQSSAYGQVSNPQVYQNPSLQASHQPSLYSQKLSSTSVHTDYQSEVGQSMSRVNLISNQGYPNNNGYGEGNASYSTPGGNWNRFGNTPSAVGSVIQAGAARFDNYQIARDELMKRRDVKQIALKDGNLVYDIPVPSQIIPPHEKGNEEMSKIRYTAATCDPDDFMAHKYTLRPYLLGRQTELFIVLTMYNEDDVLFLKTINAVIKASLPPTKCTCPSVSDFSLNSQNITHLCERNRSKTWGPEGWKKVVVCVVSDGRTKINQRTLKALTLMGVYAEGVAKDHVGEKPVEAHIFEGTTQAVVSKTGDVSLGAVPIQMIFCLKEKNKKKLNSHRWFFNAFGSILQPNVCVLLDVGTKPTGTSIYELWKCFDKHPGVGGCCGEIMVDKGKGWVNLINPLVAAQEFEYKMSNILDKPLESVCGYISVLPGAFSAYRYKALLGQPLQSYFKGEAMNAPGAVATIFDRNMYLAEDRILCFEITTKRDGAWRLMYVKSAKAATDVPTTVAEFISQRRRWLNGSMFASIHSSVFFYKIWTSNHNFLRKIVLQLEFVYQLVQLLFSWFSLSSYFLAFYFMLQSATSTVGGQDPFFGAGSVIFQVFTKLYISIIFVIIISSLGNRPQGSKFLYVGALVFLAVCQVLLLYSVAFVVYNAVPHTEAGWEDTKSLFSNPTFVDIVISMAATYGLYVVGSLIHLQPWHLFTSIIQYMLLLPFLVNALMIYSMCNLSDLSWGTKGDNGAAKDLGAAKKVGGKEGQEAVEVQFPQRQDDVTEVWIQARSELRQPAPEIKEKRDSDTKRSDSDRNFRTNVVLAFVGSNLVVILIFTSSFFLQWINVKLNVTDPTFNPYLEFLFWAVAGLSAIRFVGSFLYIILRIVGQ